MQKLRSKTYQEDKDLRDKFYIKVVDKKGKSIKIKLF